MATTKKKHVKAIIQLRRATEAEWIEKNPVLRNGEPALSTDINKLKVGDGVQTWSELPYIDGILDSEVTSTSNNAVTSSAIHYAISEVVEDFELKTPRILFNTKAEWDAQPQTVGVKNTIYIYTDYRTDEDGNEIMGIKLGDGNAYLIDMPFTDEAFLNHINDTTIHITAEERAFWNEKVRCYYSLIDEDTVVFTTN